MTSVQQGVQKSNAGHRRGLCGGEGEREDVPRADDLTRPLGTLDRRRRMMSASVFEPSRLSASHSFAAVEISLVFTSLLFVISIWSGYGEGEPADNINGEQINASSARWRIVQTEQAAV